jgi:hypothetical protein
VVCYDHVRVVTGIEMMIAKKKKKKKTWVKTKNENYVLDSSHHDCKSYGEWPSCHLRLLVIGRNQAAATGFSNTTRCRCKMEKCVCSSATS